MGSFFTTSNATQATDNSQVGVQGGIGIGSGTSGAVAAGESTAIKDVGTGSNVTGGQVINITTSDVEALHTVQGVTVAALEANQNVSNQSINAAQQVAINALETLQSGNQLANESAAGAVAATQAIAASAAPQSDAAQSEALASIATGGSSIKNQIIVAVVAAVIIAGLAYYTKNKV